MVTKRQRKGNEKATLIKSEVGGRSTCEGNSALLPSDVIEIAAMLRTQRFWREIVSFFGVT